MSRDVSERWKRRVGRLHWTPEEDEFVRYMPPQQQQPFNDDKETSLDDILVTSFTTAHEESIGEESMGDLVMLAIVAATMTLALLLVWRRRRAQKIPLQIQPSLGAKSSIKRENDQSGSVNTETGKKRKECGGNNDDIVAVKRAHHEDENSLLSLRANDKTSHSETTPQETSHRPKAIEQSTADGFQSHVEIVGEVDCMSTNHTLPILVTEETRTTDDDTISITAALSNARQLISFNENNLKSQVETVSTLPNRSVDKNSIVAAAAAQDAMNVAQSIRVTQAVFEQHGLSPSLATEWAMRRQTSELSEASRQRLDDRRLYVEAVQRHEDRKVSERHFREMKTSMEYDNDWLQKIHKARDKCLQACLQSLSLSMVVLLVMEAYCRLPSHTSTWSFVGILLGCDCDDTDDMCNVDSSTTSNGWSLTWFSDYFTAAVIWLSSYDSPFCYARCIALRLFVPICIQVALNFCRCPTLLHQAITLLMTASLLSSQLALAISDFVLSRVLPMTLVTLVCMTRTWTVASSSSENLQQGEVDRRKQLEAALISLDSLSHKVMLAHVCAAGLLTAMLPKASG